MFSCNYYKRSAYSNIGIIPIKDITYYPAGEGQQHNADIIVEKNTSTPVDEKFPHLHFPHGFLLGKMSFLDLSAWASFSSFSVLQHRPIFKKTIFLKFPLLFLLIFQTYFFLRFLLLHLFAFLGPNICPLQKIPSLFSPFFFSFKISLCGTILNIFFAPQVL